MAELFEIYDGEQHIGAIPISPQQLKALHGGTRITIQFHTPRMLTSKIAPRAGSFEVFEREGKLFSTDPEMVKTFIALQAEIRNAQGDGSLR